MGTYIAKRLLQLIPILFCITLLSFALMYLAGGDAVSIVLENAGMAVTQEAIDAKKAELGLDQPFLVQYGNWLIGFLTGDLGTSYVSGNDVFETFVSKLPATIVLAVVSVLLTVAISIPLGILTAVKRNKLVDYVVRICCFVGNSLPNFFLALLLIYLFAVQLGWLPVLSSTTGKEGLASLSVRGTILPAATLAIAMSAKYTRQIRATVLEELDKPYVAGARARGVPEAVILVKNVLPSCMVMIVTLIALSIGDLLGGTAIVETIFQWDGVGKLAVDSITMRDYPMIQAYVVWMAVIYVGVNLVADIVYRLIDPRIRLAEGGERSSRRRKKNFCIRSTIVCMSEGRRKVDDEQNDDLEATKPQVNDFSLEDDNPSLPQNPRTIGILMQQTATQLQKAPEIRPEPSDEGRSVAPRSDIASHEAEPIPVRTQKVGRDHTSAKLAVFATLAGVIILVAIFAEWIVPYDPYAQDLTQALQAPSAEHLMGTDRYGRDLLSRVIMGAQSSIFSTLALVVVITVVGSVVGVVAGWRGGWVDTLLMRASDVFLAFPGLVFALAVAGVLGGGLQNAAIALAAISWPKYARVARSLTLTQKELPYIAAARLAGCNTAQILLRHVLPNIAGPILVTAVLDIGTMMMELAGLSFLGLGAQVPMAEWGSMMADNRNLLQLYPWTVMGPGVAIFLTVLVFNLLGDTLRDWMDPEHKAARANARTARRENRARHANDDAEGEGRTRRKAQREGSEAWGNGRRQAKREGSGK